jgi:DNA-binding IclR family transcriptional regulator
MSDPAVQACRRNLADLRQARFALSGADLEASVREVILPVVRDGGSPWFSAIVVTEPASYGTSRQFQVFAEAGIQTALFADPGAALTWLLMQEPAQ